MKLKNQNFRSSELKKVEMPRFANGNSNKQDGVDDKVDDKVNDKVSDDKVKDQVNDDKDMPATDKAGGGDDIVDSDDFSDESEEDEDEDEEDEDDEDISVEPEPRRAKRRRTEQTPELKQQKDVIQCSVVTPDLVQKLTSVFTADAERSLWTIECACGEKFSLDAYVTTKHFTKCSFRHIQCPMCDTCTWKGSVEDLVKQHVPTEHASQFRVLRNTVWEVSLFQHTDQDRIMLIHYQEENIYVLVCYKGYTHNAGTGMIVSQQNLYLPRIYEMVPESMNNKPKQYAVMVDRKDGDKRTVCMTCKFALENISARSTEHHAVPTYLCSPQDLSKIRVKLII